MRITYPNMFVLYFTACPMHYFYNSLTSCNRQKRIVFLKSAWKNMFIKKNIKHYAKINNIKNTQFSSSTAKVRILQLRYKVYQILKAMFVNLKTISQVKSKISVVNRIEGLIGCCWQAWLMPTNYRAKHSPHLKWSEDCPQISWYKLIGQGKKPGKCWEMMH